MSGHKRQATRLRRRMWGGIGLQSTKTPEHQDTSSPGRQVARSAAHQSHQRHQIARAPPPRQNMVERRQRLSTDKTIKRGKNEDKGSGGGETKNARPCPSASHLMVSYTTALLLEFYYRCDHTNRLDAQYDRKECREWRKKGSLCGDVAARELGVLNYPLRWR